MKPVDLPATRDEHDLLGERAVPAAAYWGIHTLRAVENFPISGQTVASAPDLVNALAAIKQAAALANRDLGLLDPERAAAIVAACEEIRAGRSVEAAIIRTVETAGRTIAVSALTVAVSLSALLVFPLYFLRSFAYAGVGVTLVAMATSVITLPALMAVLGHRVDSLRLWKRTEPKPVGDGMWHTIATVVMKRPLVIGAAVVALLVFLGTPFFGVEFGLPDQRVLPEDTPARITTERIADDFSSEESSAMPVVALDAADPDDTTIDAYAVALALKPSSRR